MKDSELELDEEKLLGGSNDEAKSKKKKQADASNKAGRGIGGSKKGSISKKA